MSTINPIQGDTRPFSTAGRQGDTSQSAFSGILSHAREQAASGFAAGAGSRPIAGPTQVQQDFLDFAALSTEERMFLAALAALGITKEDYEAMSPAEKQALSKKIQLVMQETIQQRRSGEAHAAA